MIVRALVHYNPRFYLLDHVSSVGHDTDSGMWDFVIFIFQSLFLLAFHLQAYTVYADGISRQHVIATASSEKGPSTYVKLWMTAVDEPNDDNDPNKTQPSPDDDTINHDPPQPTTVILPKGDSAASRYHYFCGTRRQAALIMLLLLSLLAIGFPRKITSFVRCFEKYGGCYINSNFRSISPPSGKLSKFSSLARIGIPFANGFKSQFLPFALLL